MGGPAVVDERRLIEDNRKPSGGDGTLRPPDYGNFVDASVAARFGIDDKVNSSQLRMQTRSRMALVHPSSKGTRGYEYDDLNPNMTE